MGRYDGTEGIECIRAIRNALTYEEFRGFCKGNIIKYVWREARKGFIVDVTKALDYANYLIEADIEKIDAAIRDADISADDLDDDLRNAMGRRQHAQKDD